MIHDAESGELLETHSFSGNIDAIAVSPDDSRLLIAVHLAPLQQMDLNDPARLLTPIAGGPNDHGGVYSMAFSSNGRWLAVGTHRSGFHLLDRKSKEWRNVKTEPSCNFLTFCNNDAWVAFGQGATQPDNVSIVDVETCSQIAPLPGAAASLSAGDPHGSTLAASSSDRIKIWSLPDRSLKLAIGKSEAKSVAINSSGNVIAISQPFSELRAGAVGIFDTTTGKLLRELITPLRTRISELAFSKDGSRLAACGLHGGIWIFDTNTWQEVGWKEDQPRSTCLTGLSVRPDGRVLATSDQDQRFRLWDLESIHLIATHVLAATNAYSASNVAFDSTGQFLVYANDLNTLSFADPKTGEPNGRFSIPVKGPVHSVVFHPQMPVLYAVAGDGEVYEIDAENRELIQKFPATDRTPIRLSMKLSRDGATMVIGVDYHTQHGIRLIDTLSGETISDSDVGFLDAEITPDLKSVFTITESKGILAPISDLNQYRPLSRVNPGRPGLGRTSAVNPVTGDLIASHGDGKLTFWKANGDLVREFPVGPPGGAITKLTHSPDGRYLLTANGNGTIYIFRVDN